MICSWWRVRACFKHALDRCFEKANALLQSDYEENPARDVDDRTEEADKVSARIAALLSEKAFSFTPNEYLSIHRKLFTGIFVEPVIGLGKGKYRFVQHKG